MALSSPLLLLAAAAAVILLSFFLYRRLSVRLPPGPRPSPVFGNLYHMTTPVQFRCFARWAEKYGPIMSVWLGTTLTVVVSSSELAKEVLKEHDQQLADRQRSRSNTHMSRGGKDLIWADYGPHYVKVRKLCNLELFSAKRLEVLRPIREDEVTAMVEAVFRHCTLNPDDTRTGMKLRDYITTVSFNNITRLVFGKRFIDDDGLNPEGVELMEILTNKLKLPPPSPAHYMRWLRWLFPSDEEAFKQMASRRDRFINRIMESVMAGRRSGGGGSGGGGGRRTKQDFLNALFDFQGEYDIDEDTISGLILDMLIAGIDTTVINAEWTMAELVRNPRVQAKLQSELDRVVGTDRILTENDFPNLPYLHCVVKEGFRLHPPTPLMLPHKAKSHVKLAGYDVPKGSAVMVNVWAIGRDPRVWKDPEEFRPERFLEEDVDMKGHDFRLLPFGAGRRVCPGAQLGIVLVQSILGHLVHHFEWRLPEGVRAEEVDMGETPGTVTFMKTPIRAVAAPRLAAHLYKRHACDA